MYTPGYHVASKNRPSCSSSTTRPWLYWQRPSDRLLSPQTVPLPCQYWRRAYLPWPQCMALGVPTSSYYLFRSLTLLLIYLMSPTMSLDLVLHYLSLASLIIFLALSIFLTIGLSLSRSFYLSLLDTLRILPRYLHHPNRKLILPSRYMAVYS